MVMQFSDRMLQFKYIFMCISQYQCNTGNIIVFKYFKVNVALLYIFLGEFRLALHSVATFAQIKNRSFFKFFSINHFISFPKFVLLSRLHIDLINGAPNK